VIREIVIYGDPVLRTKGKPVTEINDEVRQLAADMLDTMHEANGVGLAAQQVGVAIQLTVIDVSDAAASRPSRMWINGEEVPPTDYMPLYLVNPQVEAGREIEIGTEGCLSFPDITADISRAAHVRVRALNLDGRPVEFEAEGLLARAVQHEVDHLNGILFIDRMNSAAKAALGGRLKRLAAGNVR
jgi:peptide deformylase